MFSHRVAAHKCYTTWCSRSQNQAGSSRHRLSRFWPSDWASLEEPLAIHKMRSKMLKARLFMASPIQGEVEHGPVAVIQ